MNPLILELMESIRALTEVAGEQLPIRLYVEPYELHIERNPEGIRSRVFQYTPFRQLLFCSAFYPMLPPAFAVLLQFLRNFRKDQTHEPVRH